MFLEKERAVWIRISPGKYKDDLEEEKNATIILLYENKENTFLDTLLSRLERNVPDKL